MQSLNGALLYDKADAEYNSWFIDHIIEIGSEYGLNINLILSEDIVIDDLKRYNFVISRNRNYEIAKALENLAIRCINNSKTIEIGNDKYKMYKAFSEANIPQMYTQETKLPYPFVVKPRNGHGGQNVYLVNNEIEFEKVADDINNNVIYQIPATDKGRDIRAYVVGDTILTAMERKAANAEDDFRANFSLGGTASEYSLNEDEIKLVSKVVDFLKPDFIGVDIIYNNGKPVVNEIEDAVGTRMLYKYTDIDPVREYIKWIDRTLRQ